MSSYEGPRSIDELNAIAVPASEIIELNSVAVALGFGHIEIVRSSVGSHLASPDDHPCLEEDGRWLMSIWDPSEAPVDYEQHLQSSFILQLSEVLSGQSLWTTGATYFALGLQVGCTLILPDRFCPSPEFCTELGNDWSGLGASISPEAALVFMQTLAKYNPSKEAIQCAIGQVNVWLDYRGRFITSGEALLQEFEAMRPDLGYEPTGVRAWARPSRTT